jgi:hypothetical protein
MVYSDSDGILCADAVVFERRNILNQKSMILLSTFTGLRNSKLFLAWKEDLL